MFSEIACCFVVAFGFVTVAFFFKRFWGIQKSSETISNYQKSSEIISWLPKENAHELAMSSLLFSWDLCI